MVRNMRSFSEIILTLFLALCCGILQRSDSVVEATEHHRRDEMNENGTGERNMTDTRESAEKMVICYFASWAGTRDGDGAFLPEDIDPTLCTHIMYAFASLSNESLTMESGYPTTDIGQNFFARVVDLKKQNPNLKVMIALGGWMDSEGSKYSRLVEDSESREKFIKDAIDFLKTYEFDGLDLDWEYPVCWQADCAAGKKEDRDNFSVFLQELRKAFDEVDPPFLLSIATSASLYILENAYDIQEIVKSLDFIIVMGYDLHGSYEKVTGHHSQLYPRDEDANIHLNVDSAMKYFVEQGAPAEKLILGIPFYGRSFTLEDSTNHSIDAPAVGAGDPGVYTKSSGILAYFEICDLLKNDNWTVERDAKAGPYAYKDNQWVSYDDPTSALQKAEYVVTNGYGGVMVWDITTDDFKGLCSDQKYPMMKSLNLISQHEDDTNVTSNGNDIKPGTESGGKTGKDPAPASGAETAAMYSVIMIFCFVLLMN